MADYISREAAIEAIWKPEVRPNDLIFDALRRACEEEVKHIPAADVVEVVRCKDCRFYYKDSDGYEMCDASEGYDHISADGFCAWAKRRADK